MTIQDIINSVDSYVEYMQDNEDFANNYFDALNEDALMSEFKEFEDYELIYDGIIQGQISVKAQFVHNGCFLSNLPSGTFATVIVGEIHYQLPDDCPFTMEELNKESSDYVFGDGCAYINCSYDVIAFTYEEEEADEYLLENHEIPVSDIKHYWQYDKHDSWGCIMGLLFSVVAEMSYRGLDIPSEYEYRGQRVLESSTDFLCRRLSNESLERLHPTLWKVRQKLIDNGEDY